MQEPDPCRISARGAGRMRRLLAVFCAGDGVYAWYACPCWTGPELGWSRRPSRPTTCNPSPVVQTPQAIRSYSVYLAGDKPPAFEAQWAAAGRVLPNYVRREFDEYLQCGRLEHGFLRVRCASCHAEPLVAFGCTNSRRFRRPPWLVPQLRGTSYGRKCRLAG